ncbi:flagellar biosynthetic protein FliO [Undibacterium rugosum]|uniref:Flagellar protein n=1 Tax=Undibacterium rugosum TaxID=2762291 RepID=A0A923KZE1_9BURK|nr:flagellar biosynthetic protein FliO [Undibacterium rugosum]MBC3934926.1 flagellar biosynthetic protein FliO [Undibacterium rugosum]MBR7778213.1 flagellar biosynthetic protein FliO [Undibacterium rugosum]
MQKLSPSLLLMLPTLSLAAENTAVTPTTGFLQIVLALLFILGLMFAAAWAFKRITPVGQQNRLALKIVGGLNLGQRERILVVEIGDQWMILGVTAHNINQLGQVARQEQLLQQAGADGSAFQSWLQKTIAKRNETDASAPPRPPES